MANFGRRSLNEVREVFLNCGLRLGMQLPPEVVEHGSAWYEAQRAAASSAPEPPVAPAQSEPDPIKSGKLSPKLISEVLLKQIRLAKNLPQGSASDLRQSVLKLLRPTLDSMTVDMSHKAALEWHQELCELIGSEHFDHMTLGPLLYKFWGVVERERTKPAESA